MTNTKKIRKIVNDLFQDADAQGLINTYTANAICEIYTKKFASLISSEFVICAAVKTTTGRIYRGHRHGDCFKAILARDQKPSSSGSAQGFITSKNRYVTREQGRKLQDAAGIPSADKDGYRGKTLFSEDLY